MERWQQDLERRYHTEKVFGPWTQAEIDRHKDLQAELQRILAELNKRNGERK